MKNFSRLLSVLAAALLSGHAMAQSPTDPPLCPWSAEDVYVIYAADGDQYTAAEGTEMTVLDWGGQDQVSDDEAGDYAAMRIVAGTGNYTPLQFAKTQNWSDYKYLHMDVWAYEDCKFYAVFRNWSAGVRSGSEVLDMKKGQWYSLDFDLSTFAWSEKAGLQERIVNVLVFGGEAEGIYEGAAKASKMWVTNIIAHNEVKGGTVVSVGKQEEKKVEKPATLAPVPTHKAGNVAAAHSNTYPTKLEWALYGWSGCHFEEIDVQNGKLTWMKDADYAAVAMSGDITEMENLHADIWTPAVDGVTTVQFGLQYMVDPGKGEFYTDDAHKVTLVPGQWNSVDIPLSCIEGITLSNTKQVLRIKTDGGGKGNLFLDNVYFWNTKEIIEDLPVPATLVSRYSADQVVGVYGQYGSANFAKNAYSAGDCFEEDCEGVSIWKMTKFDYVKFTFDNIDATGSGILHFELFTPTDKTETSVQKIVLNDADKKASDVTDDTKITVRPGEWNVVEIAMDKFTGIDLSRVNMLVIGSIDRAKANHLYFANMYFIRKGVDGVDTVEGVTQTSEAYNLQGQRVGKGYRGLVVVNGRKMIVSGK